MTEITNTEMDKARVPFLKRLKWVGKPGKTNAERLQSLPEVNYQPTAIGYETLTGKPRSRQVNTAAATSSTRHSIQSAGGQKLVNGSNCHEYLAMDSMYDAIETLEENWVKKTNYIDTKMEETTDSLIGSLPARYRFPNVMNFPSFWFWLARTLFGLASIVIYIFMVLGGCLFSFYKQGLSGVLEYVVYFFTDPFPFYSFALQPLYYLFFKVLHIAGISNLFDPPFLSGAALRRDLGVLRILSKNGEIKDIPFEELEARSTTMWDGGNRAMCKLYLSHKYSKEGLIYGAPHKPAFYVGVLWEFFQHFMDVSRPLPDVPELEPYRHLDPTTREWDKRHNRPERLWRDMPRAEYMELVEASLKVAETYPYLKPSAVKEENWQPAGDGKHWYQLG